MTYMTINGRRIVLEHPEDFKFVVRGEGTEIHIRTAHPASLSVEVNDLIRERPRKRKEDEP